MKSIFLMLSLFISSGAFANAKIAGNGGDAVVCDGSVQMLDIYEAESLRDFTVSLGGAEKSTEEKIEIALRRLSSFDPERVALVKKYAQSFMAEARFMRRVRLQDIPDSYENFVPVHCHLEQIAIQNVRVVPTDPYYIVNADLWDRLDYDSVAVLVLHEAIFRATGDSWSSSMVRLYNSLAFTSFLDDKSQADFCAYISPAMSASVKNCSPIFAP